MRKYLIITADDMGYNMERNDGIGDCFRKEGVTNSSLMVNGVASEHAAMTAMKLGLSTGLHFNITEGLPVDSKSMYRTLTNVDGHFHGMRGFIQAVSDGKIDMKEVKEELKKQIAKYRTLTGSLPVYVDGHQHAHILPGLVETFAETLSEYGIRATRLPFELNMDSATWVLPSFVDLLKLFSNNGRLAKPVMKTNNIWTSDCFFGLVTMGRNMTTNRLQAGIQEAFSSVKDLPDGKRSVACELMTHPGYACKGAGGCGTGPDDFSQSPDREHEKSILESEEMKKFYRDNDITLISYHKYLEQEA